MYKKCSSHERVVGSAAELDVSYFSRDKTKPDGLSSRCKICMAIMRRPISTSEAIATVEHHLEINKLKGEGLRRCTKCHEIKPIKTGFYQPTNTSKQARGALRSYCKVCCRRHRSQWAYSDPSNILKLRNYRRRRRESDPVKKWATLTICSHKERYPNADIVLTVADICGLLPNGHGTCGYCGNEVLIGYNVSLDVINREQTIDLGNVIVCCKPCNSTKSKMPVDKFVKRLQDPAYREDITISNQRLLSAYYANQIPFEELVRLANNYTNTE